MSTAYHAKYLAYELTKRCASDSMEKLAASLADAQVDLNPHQVEAALFAFRSPLSKGAILADEVGLGKTIEAGILLSQKWAERKRKILIIVPASLRKQWHEELSEEFFLPSVVLETRTFNEQIREGNLNPFDRPEIVICSYQFARSKEPYIRQITWNLAVIDEAHRLRNVYKPSNKIGNALKSSLAPFDKLLLTATPLQNSLLELFGLVSIIDEHIFGDIKSFRSQFSHLESDGDFQSLRERLKPICQRTLRRQVLEYIPFTSRIALVEEFMPSEPEQKLYNLVSDYLQRQNLYALPASQRQLMTLILRRLLATKIAEELEKKYPTNTLIKFYWQPIIKAAVDLNLNNPASDLEHGKRRSHWSEPNRFCANAHVRVRPGFRSDLLNYRDLQADSGRAANSLGHHNR